MSTRNDALREAAEIAACEIQFAGPDSEAGRAFAYLADRYRTMAAESDEKDTRGSVPHPGGSTHQHPRPCEYPAVLPCRCPVRPRALPAASTDRARRLSLIAAAFTGARWARTYLAAGGR
ncbi:MULTISPECIES: hypothetical protein [unclassified Streptomyces]|uniref:hypothetical protein n=1 Tax=unclassified Streptomyces TaxID=2593676 RepID=UPI003429504E